MSYRSSSFYVNEKYFCSNRFQWIYCCCRVFFYLDVFKEGVKLELTKMSHLLSNREKRGSVDSLETTDAFLIMFRLLNLGTLKNLLIFFVENWLYSLFSLSLLQNFTFLSQRNGSPLDVTKLKEPNFWVISVSCNYMTPS